MDGRRRCRFEQVGEGRVFFYRDFLDYDSDLFIESVFFTVAESQTGTAR